MRRRAVFEGFNQEAELFIAVLLRQTQYLEHLRLQILVMDSDRTAAQLYAVQNDIIGVCLDCQRIGIQKLQLIQLRAGERVMHRLERMVFFVLFEHREVNDPQQIVLIIVQKSHSLRTFSSEETQRIIGYLRPVGTDKDQVVCLRVEHLCDLRKLFLREEFIYRGFVFAFMHTDPY